MAAKHNNKFQLISSEKPKTAHVSVGSEVTIPCHLSSEVSATDMEIKWFMETDCVCVYKNREVIEGKNYKGRTHLSTEELERGNVSLNLRELRKSDVGIYLCQVISGDTTEEITIRVQDTEQSTESSPTGFPGFKIDLARGALGLCKIQIEKINRAWTAEEREKMNESAQMAVDFQGMDFGQVVELLKHKNDIINKLQKQLEGEKQLQQNQNFRLVLLGRSGCEKRAAGNLIVGREEMIQAGASPEIQRSKSRQGKVDGRMVTVVETPDWFCSGGDLEELRADVSHCVQLSAPGPHAFLLVIPVKLSAGEERGMLEKIEIFGENCWKYTMILFTVTDEEQERNIEQFVQSGDQELQRLVEKCGNRFHCLNINQRDESQLSKLMENIEKMSAKNTERFYSSEMYIQMEQNIKNAIKKFKEEREVEVRSKLQGDIQEAFHRLMDKIHFLKKHICQIEERITKLEKKIKEEKDEAKIKALERELEREKQQRQRTEEKLRESMEDRQRQLEKITEMYEEDILPQIKNICWNLIARQQKYFNIKIEEKNLELEELKGKLSETLSLCEGMHEMLEFPVATRRRNSMDQPPGVMAPGSDVRLVLLGRSGCEKRAAGNLIVGREEMIQAGASPEIQRSKSRQGKVDGRMVTVVETPDWFCSGGDLEELRADVSHCVQLSAPGPHAFLLVIPVKLSAGEERGMLEKIEIFGENCWKYTMILFTITDEEQERNIEQLVQSGDQELQRLLEKCGNRFHCLNINQRDESQLSKLMENIEKMSAKNTERFYSGEIYPPESQIQKMHEKLRREREERDAFGRQVEEKDREIQTLIKQLTDLKTIKDPKQQCVIS